MHIIIFFYFVSNQCTVCTVWLLITCGRRMAQGSSSRQPAVWSL